MGFVLAVFIHCRVHEHGTFGVGFAGIGESNFRRNSSNAHFEFKWYRHADANANWYGHRLQVFLPSSRWRRLLGHCA